MQFIHLAIQPTPALQRYTEKHAASDSLCLFGIVRSPRSRMELPAGDNGAVIVVGVGFSSGSGSCAGTAMPATRVIMPLTSLTLAHTDFKPV